MTHSSFSHTSGVLLAALLLLVSEIPGADWPEWRGVEGRGIWTETGIVERFTEEDLKPVWRASIASGYTGPTVADERVYVMDRLTQPEQVERVHCFDQGDGSLLWTYTYAAVYRNVGYGAGPRASVAIRDGKAYTLGSMGHAHCLDAASGDVIWSRDLFEDYAIELPMWGISAAPLLHEDLIILQIGGTPYACVVALDRSSGRERWRALSDRASYAAPILTQQAGQTILVVWTGDNVVGLEPSSGHLLWRFPFPPRQMVIGVATPIVDNGRLLVTSFFDGSLLLQLDPERFGVSKIWHRVGESELETDGIHSMISTPLWMGDYIYGIDSYGTLRCIEAETGNRVWADSTAVRKARWSTAHLVAQCDGNGVPRPDRIWIHNEEGELLLARLTPEGFEVTSRARVIDPTRDQLNRRGGVTWSHPAFAGGHVYLRNDKELIAIDLRQKAP